jgi:hypothetical protein
MKPGFLILSALGASLSIPSAPRADAKFNWYRYNVDSAAGEDKGAGHGALFGYSSIKCDKDGNVKLGFRGHYDLKYAELKNHLWNIVVADTGLGGANSKMDMDLDPQGDPHFFFETPAYDRVLYAHKKGSGWEEKEINKLHIENLDFYNISIKVDGDNDVHMLYPSLHEGYPYATYSKLGHDGVLADPVILRPNGGISGKWNSIAVDSKNSPLLSYFIQDHSNLAISYKDGDAFTSQVIDSSDYDNAHGYFNTLQRENDTSYYDCYMNSRHGVIQIAHGKPGGAWTIEKVDTMPVYSTFSSAIRMVLDSKGSPIVAYPVVKSVTDDVIGESSLRIAYKKDSAWVYQTVDSGGATGQFLSLSILPNDMPIISYWDGTNKILKTVVGSLTAPPDTNNNGIPDYKEVVAIAVRRLSPVVFRGFPLPGFDALGRPIGISGGAPWRNGFPEQRGNRATGAVLSRAGLNVALGQ